MEIKVFPVGSYRTNCYMAWAPGSDSCIVVDPGYEPEYLLEQLRHLRKKPAAILLTHGHFDHVGGVKAISEETGCPVYIHEDDLQLNPRLTGGEVYHTHTYDEGDTMELAGLTLQVLHTPGHTPGCVCLLSQDVMFAGDTLFAGTCGRTDLPYSNPGQMRSSLARLAALEGDYQVLPGHGHGSTLEVERKTNPFLQL
jgi:glyoxylase-like metal-dependent hydrolase (beta-lactamase superfamily II)